MASGGGDKKFSGFNFNFSGLSGLSGIADQKGAAGGLLGALEGKLGKLVGSSSGYYDKLPNSIKKRINALRTLNKTYKENEKKFRAELEELRKKYDALSAPLFERRTKIVGGVEEPTEEEVVEGERIKKEKDEQDKKEAEEAGLKIEEEKKEEKKEEEPPLYPEDTKGIPEFWLQVLRNHPVTSQLLTGESDEEALKFLTNITWKPVEGEEESFTLEFTFAENPFFTDSVLTKTYHLTISENEDEPAFERLDCSTIHWKEGKNLTVKIVKKKVSQKKKRGGRKGRGGGAKVTKTIDVEEPCETFFRFFSPPPAPTEEEEEEDEDNDMDPHAEYEAMMSDDVETGYLFKEQIIPKALGYYTGEDVSFEDYEGLDFEDGEDEEDEEDNDECGCGHPHKKGGKPHKH